MSEDSMFVQKGEPYPVELYDIERDHGLKGEPDARAATWDQAKTAARQFLQAQAEGHVSTRYKLVIWKASFLEDFPWCVKWMER